MASQRHQVADYLDIPEGTFLPVTLEQNNDSIDILVCHVAGQFYAVADRCSHRDVPLQQGTLHQCQLRCPYHGGEFDIRTGEPTKHPAFQPIQTYPVHLDDDFVLWVELPNAASSP